VSEHIRIRGQAELEAAFLQVRREVLAEIKPVLKEIGGEVAKDAQSRAGTEIRNIGPRWARMRVGVTMKGVYVAPTSKRRGGSPRPNLAGLLMDRAMQPALDAKQDAAYARLDELVNVSSARAGF
jgi:hypothetical protein